MDGVVDQCGERKGGDEFGGSRGHDHAHLGSASSKFTGEQGRFVSRDASSDAQNDASSEQGHVRMVSIGQGHGQGG